MECYTLGSPAVGDKRWVDHYSSVVHTSWRFQKEMDGIPDNIFTDILYKHVKGGQSLVIASAAVGSVLCVVVWDVDTSLIRVPSAGGVIFHGTEGSSQLSFVDRVPGIVWSRSDDAPISSKVCTQCTPHMHLVLSSAPTQTVTERKERTACLPSLLCRDLEY